MLITPFKIIRIRLEIFQEVIDGENIFQGKHTIKFRNPFYPHNEAAALNRMGETNIVIKAKIFSQASLGFGEPCANRSSVIIEISMVVSSCKHLGRVVFSLKSRGGLRQYPGLRTNTTSANIVFQCRKKNQKPVNGEANNNTNHSGRSNIWRWQKINITSSVRFCVAGK